MSAATGADVTFGIQKKYALTISAFLVIVFSFSCWGIISYTSAHTRENIQKQQYAMTEIIARSIDDKLGTWLVALSDVSNTIPEDAFHNRTKAQHLLDERSGIRSMFDDGIMLLDRDLRIVAENPYIAGRRGVKVTELESFLRSVEKNGLPDISNPYSSPISNSDSTAPVVIMAVPINDDKDRLLGFLAGSINLTSDYFIEEVMGFKIGKGGYLYLISKDNIMILHPDKSRIMKQGAPPGRNKLLDKAFLGFEGSGETINSRGVKQLASFKSLKTVDWILGCVFLRDEAYEPVYRLRSYLLTASFLIVMISIVLIWILTAKITSNIKSFTQQVRIIGEKPSVRNPITISSNDEVGVLAAAFNGLLNRLAEKESKLLSQRDLLEQQTVELKDSLDKIKVLGGIIPICAWCKKIRNDSGYWDQLEHYISEHSDADFSHGVCPECFEKQKQEIDEMLRESDG